MIGDLVQVSTPSGFLAYSLHQPSGFLTLSLHLPSLTENLDQTSLSVTPGFLSYWHPRNGTFHKLDSLSCILVSISSMIMIIDHRERSDSVFFSENLACALICLGFEICPSCSWSLSRYRHRAINLFIIRSVVESAVLFSHWIQIMWLASIFDSKLSEIGIRWITRLTRAFFMLRAFSHFKFTKYSSLFFEL